MSIDVVLQYHSSMTPLRPTFVKHEFYIAPICVDSVQINLT